jgi:hypothetical protein
MDEATRQSWAPTGSENGGEGVGRNEARSAILGEGEGQRNDERQAARGKEVANGEQRTKKRRCAASNEEDVTNGK